MKISKEAIDLIVRFEVSSKAAYEKKYRHPEWPGVQSGVTVGIGYDCGYHTKEQIRKDWTGKIPADQVEALASTSGVRGGAAQAHMRRVKNQVDVPWEAAMKVFEETSMPKWIATVKRALPNTEKLSEDSLGALVSLAYNRGASFGMQGSRYTEMRNIKTHMANQQFNKIPGELRAMKRIWPGVRGLQVRRDQEADLFAKGLSKPSQGITPETGTAGGVIITGTTIATQTPTNYLPYVIGGTVLVAVIAYIIVKMVRKPTIEEKKNVRKTTKKSK